MGVLATGGLALTLIDALPEAILVTDDSRRYLDANAAACTLLGMPREQLLACRVDDLALVTASALDTMWSDLLRSGSARARVSMKHPENGTVEVDVEARAHVAPGLHATVLRKAEANVRAFDLLELQSAVLAPDLSFEDAAHLVCERAAALTGADGAVIEMAVGDMLEYHAAHGSLAGFLGMRLPQAGSLSGAALTQRAVLVCDDSETDDRVAREACRKVGVRSMVVVPLVHDADVVGILKVSSGRAGAFTSSVVDLLRVLASVLATALARAGARDAHEALEKRERERVTELVHLREELTSLVVHDLRSPLASIVANLEYLRMTLPQTSDEAIEAAVAALAATTRIGGLLEMLLDLARLEQRQIPIVPVDVDAHAMADELLAERRRQLQAQELRVHNGIPTGAMVHADASLLRRAIDNVVDNAIRFTPPGGELGLASVERGDTIELRIGNSGPPVPEELRERIFQKFGQERQKVGNFGLGLYFCRLVVEAHGGRIWVDSEPRLPTVFALSLPRISGQAAG